MHGLFIGLTTLDLIYQSTVLPEPNQKLVASDYTISAGGPATNAAVAFSDLGNQATVLSSIGCHPIAHLILTDLQQWGVNTIDLTPDRSKPPPVSSIIVTETGDRAVISINAVKTQAVPSQIPTEILTGVDIVLIDGHQMAVGRTLVQQAKNQGIPVAIDGGSWKPDFETVLPFVDYAICSANFHPPGCQTNQDAIAYLQHHSVSQIAITQGEQPIEYWCQKQAGQVSVPRVRAIDTLGAGDIFHGAFCHFILQMPFVEALAEAAQVAARSCQSFGTRQWMEVSGWQRNQANR